MPYTTTIYYLHSWDASVSRRKLAIASQAHATATAYRYLLPSSYHNAARPRSRHTYASATSSDVTLLIDDG